MRFFWAKCGFYYQQDFSDDFASPNWFHSFFPHYCNIPLTSASFINGKTTNIPWKFQPKEKKATECAHASSNQVWDDQDASHVLF